MKKASPGGASKDAAGASAISRRKPAKGPFKLLALDLDGTLLDHDGNPRDEDVAAVRALAKRGVKITILTGRLYSGTRPSAEVLGIQGPVGCADGSHIVHAKGHKTLFHRGICGPAAKKLRESLAEHALATFLFAEQTIVHDESGADYLPFLRTWSTDLRLAEKVTDHELWRSRTGMTAVVAVGNEAGIDRAVAALGEDAAAMHVATFPFRRESEHWGMVARAAGGTKATALAWVAEHYGVGVHETVCVGDWLNDIPMLQEAGRSFAMAQAPDEVKQSATDVLERSIHDGGGIKEAIERAFGTGRTARA